MIIIMVSLNDGGQKITPSLGGDRLTDPNYKGNGKGQGWMPVFRIFRFLFGSWFESDPRTKRDIPAERRDIIDDLDISEDKEENGDS